MSKFYSYARRVRHCVARGVFSINTTSCVQLSQLEHGLLPLLNSLSIPNVNMHKDRFPILLPSLVRSRLLSSIQCSFDNNKHAVGWFLKSVSESILTLRHIGLTGTLQREHISCLSHLHRLQSLSLQRLEGPCTYEIIDALSYLQLTQLTLGLKTLEQAPRRNMAHNPFPVLISLRLDARMPPILYILDAISGDRLKSLQILEYDIDATRISEAAEQHSRIYQNFARFASLRQVVHYLNVGFSQTWTDIDSHHSSPLSVVQPLLGLRHLEDVELEFLQPWFRLSDNDISDLAVAIPLVKNLHLMPFTETDIVNPTFESLRFLASNCRELISLTITIDTKMLPFPSTPIQPHGLQNLDLLSTTIDRPLLFATLLRPLFPHLRSVYGDGLQEIRSMLVSC